MPTIMGASTSLGPLAMAIGGDGARCNWQAMHVVSQLQDPYKPTRRAVQLYTFQRARRHMATIDDVRPAILEIEVYDGVVVGQALEITATLLDLEDDALPFIRPVREEGAQAFGMLFFRDGSTEWPKHGVLWLRLERGLVVAPEDSEFHFLEDQSFMDLCLRMTSVFLTALARRDPKYSDLVFPVVH